MLNTYSWISSINIEVDKFVFDLLYQTRNLQALLRAPRKAAVFLRLSQQKYELLLLDYDTSGYSIGDYAPYSYGYINNVYNTQSYRTISNNFLNIRGAGAINLDGKFDKFERCTIRNKAMDTCLSCLSLNLL